jgi:hypothetical protein
VWLLQVALAIAGGLGLAIVFIPVVLLALAVFVGAVVAGGLGAAVVAVIPLAVLLVALGVVAGGLLGAYLSAYWTLAFRRVELEPPPPAVTPQMPYGPTRDG